MSQPILTILAENEQKFRIHLIGVAGSGMSGLASLLMQLGHFVSGSDRVSSLETARLEKKGLLFSSPHHASCAEGVDMVIYSSAIKAGNAVYDAALQDDIPLIRRAEALAAIMKIKKGVIVAGAHGKTTTSALLAHCLRLAQLHPSHYVGAEIPILGSNSHWDQEGELFVAEGDESDGTLVQFHPQQSILLNVEAEHLDFYESEEEIHSIFLQLIEQTEKAVIYCAEDSGACQVIEKAKAAPENTQLSFISYGWNKGLDFSAEILETRSCSTRFLLFHHEESLGEFTLGIPGKHNVLNALAAIAISRSEDAPLNNLMLALETFRGAKRRFEVKLRGEYTVLDDYGHHPSEISATLETAKSIEGKRLIVLFQPHRYSRTQLLKEEFGACFTHADELFVSNIYPASERPLPGISGQTIVDEVTAQTEQSVMSLPEMKQARLHIGNMMRPGDIFISLGAGDIHEVSTALARDLKVLEELNQHLDGEPARCRLYEPMSRHTTLRVGGPAQFWVAPESEKAYRRAVDFFRNHAIPIRVIGRGSNLLVKDGGITGAVIHPSRGALSEVQADRETGEIKAGVGARLKKITSAAKEAEIGGFEWMEGIPGNVGGAIRMNAGAMGIDTFEQVINVSYIDSNGETCQKPVEEIEHHYRNVPEFQDHYVLSATFSGQPHTSQSAIAEKIELSRTKRKTSQPIAASAGCIFKNPQDSQNSEGAVKIGAGQLIDELGLKETTNLSDGQEGLAQVSAAHGNFIVNRGGASAADVLDLIEKIQERALRERGIHLETEVQIIGEDQLSF